VKPDEIIQSIQPDAPAGQRDISGKVLLETSPEKLSFTFKYILAFTPLVLVFVCIFARYVLDIIIRTFFSVATGAIGGATAFGGSANNLLNVSGAGLSSGTMNALLPGSMNSIGPAVSYGTNISILMIAPVGIFIVFAAIGWSLRIAEMWTGVALTLALSVIVGMLLVICPGTGAVQDQFLLLLNWIAFLVQPFSILAAIISLVWLEKFRKSIRYTITDVGVSVRGGIWQKQEHLIPHSQIGRVVLEQNFLGTRYHFGTVIPVSNTQWGEETSFRGIGASGQKDNLGAGIMFAKGRQEASRAPLDCLYGIPDPEKAQQILTEYISRQAGHEAEQVSYLKKICENGTPRVMTDELRCEVPPCESVPDLIKKIAELRDAGIISEEEFAAKKTELLKRI